VCIEKFIFPLENLSRCNTLPSLNRMASKRNDDTDKTEFNMYHFTCLLLSGRDFKRMSLDQMDVLEDLNLHHRFVV